MQIVSKLLYQFIQVSEMKHDILKKPWRKWLFFYTRLMNQYKFKDHSFFSASFYKINEEDHRSDEIELFFNLNNNQNLTESDINKINVKSQLDYQVQLQETKESGWIVDEINSLKLRFYKTGESSGSIYVKILLRSNAI